MEKLLLLVMICLYSGFAETQQTRHIETAGSARGRWYQSTGIRTTGSNQLVFEVKGSRDAVLELATDDNHHTRHWTIVLGGHANRKDFLRYKYWKRGAQSEQCNRNSLSQSEYRTLWLSWDHNSIRLGKGDTVGENKYCKLTSTDTNMPTDFYLRLGSWKRNTINWKIHLSGQLTQHIQTSDSGSGDWFQSTGIRITGSNWLVFQAKGSRDAILGLATDDTNSALWWNIVIGGGGNQRDFLRCEKPKRREEICSRRSLSQTEYRTFWLSWDHSSIRLGDGDTVGQNQYCEQSSTDTNTPTDFFLRLGSWNQNTVNWIIRGQDFTDTSDASCGHRPLADSHRIVGGSESLPHSWPWQVSLRNLYGHHDCGGSLIANNYIITAAHCDPRVGRSVYVGAHNRTTCEEPCKRVTVTRLSKHRDYRRYPVPNNDIAIVKFSPPVNFSDSISPICLPEADYSPYDSNAECYATGWGRLSFGGPSPNGLQEVQLPIVSQTQCRNRLGSDFEEQTMVCAGNVTDGGIDACQGDSGGPLACHTFFEDRWKLFGITSFGYRCAEPRNPGVYTKVTNYVQWIQNIIKNDDARFDVRMPAHK